MSSGSNIEWTDSTWNPVVGCTKVSDGCRNCYAMVMAQRVAAAGDKKAGASGIGHRASGKMKAYRQVVKRDGDGLPLPQWNNKVVCIEEALTEPLKWRTPRRVFVNSMSDLFHEDVPFEFIDKVFAVMAVSQRHTFQILTKRPSRMAEYLNWTNLFAKTPPRDRVDCIGKIAGQLIIDGHTGDHPSILTMPLPNVWLGVSVEDQGAADARIPLLVQCPAVVRFLSVEPMLGAVDLTRVRSAFSGGVENFLDTRVSDIAKRAGIDKLNGIDWVIVGGESGPGARPCDVAWVRDIVRQCRQSGVPCFVKQLGAHVLCANDRVADWLEEVGGGVDYFDLPREAQVYQGMPLRMRLADRKGGDMSEWPSDLRVREFPKGGVSC